MAMSNTDVGDGDFCPLVPAHGRMIHMKGYDNQQWCPHTDHDGKPASAPDGPIAPSRAFWPTGVDSFPAAVAAAQ